MGTYSGLEEHNHIRFTCSSHSTSFPGRDIVISWKINGTEVQKIGDDRFQVVDVDFWIHNVLRQDNGSDVLCEATDDNGKTIVSSETVKIVVYWGPDIVSLKPTNMVYHVARGTKINPITASADCNPPCFYTWRKRGKNESLSTNATLKIEVASEDTEGEYIFSATRNGTTKTTSIVILLDKDTHGPRNPALTVCLSVVLVLAVLLAAVGIFYLYKHGYFGQCRDQVSKFFQAIYERLYSSGTDIPHNDARGSSENYYEPLELRTVQATNSLDIRDPPFQSSTYENDDMSEGSPLTDDNIYEEMGEDEEDSYSTSSMETEL